MPLVRDRSGTWRVVGVVIAGIALATVVVAVLERIVGIPDASPVYLVAVVVSGISGGTVAAVVTAFASIVVYDLLFTQPFMTLAISDTHEWLSLVLLLFVAVAVGQLVALQRRRTEEVVAREREARDLYSVTRALATRTSTMGALSDIAAALRERTGMDRVWVALGAEEDLERVVADTGSGPLPSAGGTVALLRRTGGDASVEWVLVHGPTLRGRGPAARLGSGLMRYRATIEAGGTKLGSLWGVQARSEAMPDPVAQRLLAVTADQVGQALVQDRLAAEAAGAEIARQGSALKSALIESVSHDLRTPLASIRAAAGTLMDRDVSLSPEDVATSATSIDREAARLDRLVTNLLDLGRIEGGTLRAAHEVIELGELVGRALRRLSVGSSAGVAERPLELSVEDAWVEADPVLLEAAVLNLLENALRYCPPDALVRVSASPSADGATVRLTVEDAGPGVPTDELPRLFEKFYRASPAYRTSSARRSARPGTGLGLAIVRGFVEAMGGRATARRSELGGLAIDLDLRPARIPAEILGAA